MGLRRGRPLFGTPKRHLRNLAGSRTTERDDRAITMSDFAPLGRIGPGSSVPDASRVDAASPSPMPETTPLELRAFFGSSRVQENFPRPRPTHPTNLTANPRIVRSPPPTLTLVRFYRSRSSGRRKRGLSSPWPRNFAYNFTLRLQSKLGNRIFKKSDS